MSAEILNGTRLAQRIRSQIRQKLKKLKFTPGLAVVQVGDDPASTLYIKHKQRDCEKVHFHSEVHRIPVDITQQALIDKVMALNIREDIHGILVQMPLPGTIDAQVVIDAIVPDKDVDGLTPFNLGNLFINRETITPCTPTGIIRLIELTREPIEGKHAVCVGRSHLVGKPVGVMLLNRNATVTYCHSRTKNLAEVTKEADILVAAVGKPEFITADMVKQGATVIDVGINSVAERLVGDVKFEEVKEIAGFITPVPGGVGPLTRAMLLENTLKLASR
ncbi:bifunctional 5,10-methylene-tetrahydrofolate dehydrogenase/5,10-methylene-tetrahydrofolate cyclohydrolase [Candidatus Poribacteria bacterium]|nr:MAG: bifunctional 5,10-methylene-tetrahydrofolate dehydrogenase/5,10-methylene-tetrahydrofolate cyclohydrolase [Candidatus Poribacteria bacterium]